MNFLKRDDCRHKRGNSNSYAEISNIVYWQEIDERLPRPEVEWSHLIDLERIRANRYLKDSDRNRFISGRSMLRRVLARFLDCRPIDVPLTTDSYGKPMLEGTHISEPAFNISGTEGMIALAVSLDVKSIGIDVEAAASATRIGSVMHYFHPEEQLYSTTPNEDERKKRLLRIWTRKEAVIKADGRGFSLNIDKFSILGNRALNYKIVNITLPKKYICALAFDCTAPNFKFTVQNWIA